jgi:dihydrofolate reductase
VTEVDKLKHTLQGEIVVYGSAQLAHTLIEHELVDEVRLMIYPVAVGTGERLFGETSDMKALRPVDVRPVGDSLALLTYEFVREAQR